jgi:hypothetical protein
MKQILASILLFVGLALNAQTNIINVPVADYTGTGQTNFTVTFTLLSPNPRTVNGILITQKPMARSSGTATNVTFTNVIWGKYRCEVSDTTVTPYTFYVGTNTLGSVQIASLITNAAALPPNPATNYYTQAQTDALLANATGALTNGSSAYLSGLVLKSYDQYTGIRITNSDGTVSKVYGNGTDLNLVSGSGTLLLGSMLSLTTSGANSTLAPSIPSGTVSYIGNGSGLTNLPNLTVAQLSAAGVVTNGQSNLSIGSSGISTTGALIGDGTFGANGAFFVSAQTHQVNVASNLNVSGIINGNGSGLTNLNATNLVGTVQAANLPALNYIGNSGGNGTNTTIYGSAAATNWFSYGVNGQLNTNSGTRIGRNINLSTGKETFLGTNGSLDYVTYTTSNNTVTFTGNGGGLTNVLTTNQNAILNSALTLYQDGYLVAMNNSYLPPLQSCDYAGNNNYLFPSFRTNEWYFNEQAAIDNFPWALMAWPTNSTNCTITWTAHAITGTGSPKVEVWTSGVGLVASTNFTVTTTPSNYSLSFTPQKDMGVVWRANNAKWVVSNNITVTYLPTLTHPVLAGNFTRYNVSQKNLLGNSGSPNNPNTIYNGLSAGGKIDYSVSASSSRAILDFQTNEKFVVLESFSGNGNGKIFVYLDGVYYTNYSLIGNGSRGHLELNYLNIPAGKNYTTVRCVSEYASFDTGSWVVRGIYVSNTNSVKFLNTDKFLRRVWVYGDSIICGTSLTAEPLNDTQHLIESCYPFYFTTYAQSGATLYGTWTRTNTSYVSKSDTIQAAVSANPTDIYIQMGFNDASLNSYGGTNGFAIAYADAVDTLHDQLPQARIYCQGISYTTSAVSTTNDYRFAVSNLCLVGTRTNYCRYVDASALFTGSGDLIDGVHPTIGGAVVYANFIANQLITNRFTVRR